MTIDISVKPRIVENIHIGVTYYFDEVQVYTSLFREFHDVFTWYYEEMPNIDPSIVVHEIPTYCGAEPVRSVFILCTLERLPLLKKKLKKFLKMVLSF